MGSKPYYVNIGGNFFYFKTYGAAKRFSNTHGGGGEPAYLPHSDDEYQKNNELDDDTIRAAKGFKGVVKKPTAFLVGEDGHERVEITPIKKFTPKTKTPKFNTGKSNYPKLNLQRDSFTPKKSKVNIVKKLPRTNLQYPKMTDIFDMPSSIKMPKSGSMKMPRGNPYSMDMPKGDNMFGTMERSAKSKGSIFPDMGDVFNMKDVFDMPKVNSKGFNMGVEKNIFGIGDTDFDSPSRKAKKFYGKVKEKKLDNLGGFRDWGKLDDKVSDYDFKY
jgi:hypothetical protein